MFRGIQRTNNLLQAVRTIHRSYSSSKPPSFFSEYVDKSSSSSGPTPPKSIFSDGNTQHNIHEITNQGSSSQSYNQQSQPQSSRLSTIRDLTVVLSILTLSYFAVDNYRTRLVLEQKISDLSLGHMKALAVTQNNYNNHRKKREVQILNERRKTQKREMKMVYHISMLRKQLIDAGLKPVEIDEAIAEFEKNVKMETSISNVSGTALWVVDDSPMKGYVPNIHEYESKK